MLALFLGVSVAYAATDEAGAQTGSLAHVNPAFLEPRAERLSSGLSDGSEEYPLGWRPGPQSMSLSSGPQLLNAGVLDLLPATYDLRSLSRVTSVKDQNPYGTCWSFAAYGSLESNLLPTAGTWDFAEDNMVLTSGFDLGSDLYMAGGNLWMSTAYLVRWGGPVNESEDAYGDGVTPGDLEARRHVQEVIMLPKRGSALDNNGVKNAVMTYGAVQVAMYWASSYFKSSTAGYYYNGNADSNHAVLIVGWNDNYPAGNFASTPAGNGAFIVKNSWGTGWGSGGYFYVSYYDTVFGLDSYMAVYNNADPETNYSGIYQYDPLGDVVGCGYESTTGWFANAFTAQANATLSAAGFYAESPNTTYQVYTGSSLATKTLNTSGTLEYMGYHTVSLTKPVALTSGQPFIVAVKVISPGTPYPIAIEYPVSGYSSGARASSGQSYISFDGTSWVDITTQYANTSVCLKAYVTTPVPPAPTVTGLAPANGPETGGTSVTITGTGFSGVSAVTFGETPATSFAVGSSTQIMATAPGGAGSVDVRVTAAGGTSANTVADDFTYTAVGLELSTSVSGSGTIARTPDKPSYLPGEMVSLQAVPGIGWGFVAWDGDVTGGDNPETVVMDDETSIVARFSDTAVELETGWNLVAAASGTVFGGTLFGWNGSSYSSVPDPAAWQGYWTSSPAARTVYLMTAVGPQTIPLTAGWNLIGNPMRSTATLTLPPDCMAFVYDSAARSYFSSSTLQPGQGAWVRGVAGGSVTLTPVG